MALILFLDVAGVPSAFKDQMKSHSSSVENQGKWFLRDLRSERDKLNPEVGIASAYAAQPFASSSLHNCIATTAKQTSKSKKCLVNLGMRD